MHKATIASFIDKVNESDEFSLPSWPLHLTLADDFNIDIDQSGLIGSLEKFTHYQRPFEILATNDSFLGEYSEVAVTLIDTSTHLIRFHEELVRLLKSRGRIL